MSEGDDPANRGRTVIVIGAGVSGLIAAGELADRLGPDAVTVLEAGPEVGGLLRAVEVGGVRLDAGAESLLARRPETAHLLAAAGLEADRVTPTAMAARILAEGRLHGVPSRTMLGVPGDPPAVLGLLDACHVRALEAERGRAHEPLEGEDVDVAGFLTARLGGAVVRRLVEPLLAGVYAGRADRLGLRSVLPALWPAARDGGSVVDAVAAAVPAPSPGAPPVFAGVADGLHRVPAALADRLRARGVRLLTNAPVLALKADGGRWRLSTGGPHPQELAADGVLIAVPAPAAAALLRTSVPAASAYLGDVTTAHVGVVAVRLPTGLLPPEAGTGVLVPPGELPTVKAVTLSSRKWGWVEGDPSAPADVVRLSVGRAGDDLLARHDDDALVGLALADLDVVLRALGSAYGRPLSRVLGGDDVRVVRWPDALPQYEPGHLDRIARLRLALAVAPLPITLAGSVVDGVGVPACVATARAAADGLATTLTAPPEG